MSCAVKVFCQQSPCRLSFSPVHRFLVGIDGRFKAIFSVQTLLKAMFLSAYRANYSFGSGELDNSIVRAGVRLDSPASGPACHIFGRLLKVAIDHSGIGNVSKGRRNPAQALKTNTESFAAIEECG